MTPVLRYISEQFDVLQGARRERKIIVAQINQEIIEICNTTKSIAMIEALQSLSDRIQASGKLRDNVTVDTVAKVSLGQAFLRRKTIELKKLCLKIGIAHENISL